MKNKNKTPSLRQQTGRKAGTERRESLNSRFNFSTEQRLWQTKTGDLSHYGGV